MKLFHTFISLIAFLPLSEQALAHLPRAKTAACEALLRPSIRTAKTQIRMLNSGDFGKMRRILQNPEVAPRMMLDVSDANIERMVSQPQGELHFGIYAEEDETFLGIVSFWNPTEDVKNFAKVSTPLEYPGVELGYALAPASWGKGIATEVAARMTKLALDEGWAEKVIAMTTQDNIASQKVLLKAGFSEAGPDPIKSVNWFEYKRGK